MNTNELSDAEIDSMVSAQIAADEAEAEARIDALEADREEA